MTVKIVGAVLVVVACSSIGFLYAAAQRREERILRALINLLDYMECELQYQLTSLPRLCHNAATQSSGVVRDVFTNLAMELESQISPDAESCMHSALSKCRNVSQSITEILIQLGKTLGRFDIDGQLKGIELARHACESNLKKLSENKDEKLRGYQTLGICAGISLVIIFI